MTWSWLTPSRRRGVEVLDDPETPDAVRVSAMGHLARSNALLGGTRAVLYAVQRALEDGGAAPRVVLDVGTGTGDIAERLPGSNVVIGLDISECLLRVVHRRLRGVRGETRGAAVAGSALAIPLRDGCVDVVICSQLLHHFENADVAAVIRELHRVTRDGGVVVISDLRRSWLAAGGFWIASTALGFHRVTRQDGVVSVLRGFTSGELRDVVRGAVGAESRVDRRAPWRLTAVWTKRAAASATIPVTLKDLS